MGGRGRSLPWPVIVPVGVLLAGGALLRLSTIKTPEPVRRPIHIEKPQPVLLPPLVGKDAAQQRRQLALYLSQQKVVSVPLAQLLTRYGERDAARQMWLALVPTENARRIKVNPSGGGGGTVAEKSSVLNLVAPLPPSPEKLPSTANLLRGVALLRSSGDNEGAEKLLQRVTDGAVLDDEPVLRAAGASKEADAVRAWWIATLDQVQQPGELLQLLPQNRPLPPELAKRFRARVQQLKPTWRDDPVTDFDKRRVLLEANGPLALLAERPELSDLFPMFGHVPKAVVLPRCIATVRALPSMPASQESEWALCHLMESLLIEYDLPTARSVAEQIPNPEVRGRFLAALQQGLFPTPKGFDVSRYQGWGIKALLRKRPEEARQRLRRLLQQLPKEASQIDDLVSMVVELRMGVALMDGAHRLTPMERANLQLNLVRQNRGRGQHAEQLTLLRGLMAELKNYTATPQIRGLNVMYLAALTDELRLSGDVGLQDQGLEWIKALLKSTNDSAMLDTLRGCQVALLLRRDRTTEALAALKSLLREDQRHNASALRLIMIELGRLHLLAEAVTVAQNLPKVLVYGTLAEALIEDTTEVLPQKK